MILSPPAPSQASAALRFDYETTRAESLLHRDEVLAVFGFGAACPLPADARVLRVGLEPVGAASLEVWRTSGPVRHGSPVARVGKIICVGLNYADHAAETGAPIPAEPILFLRATLIKVHR